MAYGTVQAHGGTLDLRSRPGEGTEVILGFPPRCTRVSAASKALVAEAAPPVDSLRILLVDDDELIRLSVGPMLEMGGSDVVTVEGGAQALARFEEGEFPDLVLLDMNMPGMSGAETLAGMLAIRPGQAVLLATGYSDHDVLQLLEGRPNVGILQKPFSLDEVQEKVRELAPYLQGVTEVVRH